ncbi:MAG: serine/threonine protein kinase [Deltaproteobacteria bacterium]|nr:serine/threonine protein kinase [Deltaproteobacteria bacterium]
MSTPNAESGLPYEVTKSDEEDLVRGVRFPSDELPPEARKELKEGSGDTAVDFSAAGSKVPIEDEATDLDMPEESLPFSRGEGQGVDVPSARSSAPAHTLADSDEVSISAGNDSNVELPEGMTTAHALLRVLSDSSEANQVRQFGQPDLSPKYRLDRELGSGGMATVYEATQTSLKRPVAIKVLNVVGNDRMEERIRREAEALASMHHEGVIEVFDFDTTPDGRPYIVMELLHGEDLATRLARQQRIPIPIGLRFAEQLLRALGAAHANGVIHRDLKPSNVFIARGADGLERVKLLDFGTARVRDAQKLTVEGSMIGTPAYMAPEQILGEVVSERTDVYGAGLVIYEALSGKQPFLSMRFEEVLGKICSLAPKPLSEVGVSGSTVDLDLVILKALEKSPDKRWKSVGEFADALKAAVPVSKQRAVTEIVRPLPKRGVSVTKPVSITQPIPVSTMVKPPDRLTQVIAGVALIAGAFLGGMALERHRGVVIGLEPSVDVSCGPLVKARLDAALVFALADLDRVRSVERPGHDADLVLRTTCKMSSDEYALESQVIDAGSGRTLESKTITSGSLEEAVARVRGLASAWATQQWLR